MKIDNTNLLSFDRYIFLSPHLDDAAFSCGALLHFLKSKHKNVTVINFFTKGGTLNTLSAKKFLKLSGYNNAQELFTQRENEDRQALEPLVTRIINLGFQDILWRQKNNLSTLKQIIGKFVPEFIHIYPTYRFHILGKSAKPEDQLLVKEIKSALNRIIKTSSKTCLFAPLGTGGHIDHLLVRDIFPQANSSIIYYSELPYRLHSQEPNDFINQHNLIKYHFSDQKCLKMKLKTAKLYLSQFKPVFGNGLTNFQPEIYYKKQ